MEECFKERQNFKFLVWGGGCLNILVLVRVLLLVRGDVSLDRDLGGMKILRVLKFPKLLTVTPDNQCIL